MLIIGHRGAAGSAPENTLEALRHGHSVGADMLEFDVQITRAVIPIVIHDSTLLRTHGRRHWFLYTSHESIRKATEKGHQIATLEEVMEEFFGKVLLNLELKNRGTAKAVIRLVERYVTQPEDWQNILFSSFKPGELLRIRQLCPQAELAMLHHRNPFLFIAYQRKLRFSAVGFHRLYVNDLALEIAKRAGVLTYVYTVNRPHTADIMATKGIDALVTDFPEQLNAHFADKATRV